MVPATKEAQRAELHKTIWRIANDLRGSVDGWDFKSYVLGMLFYRFISENLAAYINDGEHKTGDTDFGYAKLPDSEAEIARQVTVAEKGFYILPSELFMSVRRNALDDATHLEPSRSATISSMKVRSSACRATMRAISLFSSVISTASRVSSCST